MQSCNCVISFGKITCISDCSEFLVRGGGGPFVRGVPVSNKVSEWGVPKFYGDNGGGRHPFFTQPKKKYPLHAIPHAVQNFS